MTRRWLVAGLAVAASVVGVGVLAVSDQGPAAPATVRSVPVSIPRGRVRVEVLNGGGVTGMARAATGVLREWGLDVVDFGNAPSFDAERASVVIDRVGREDLARAVAAVLGIDNVRSEPDSNLYVDVSVLLGSEWTRPGGEPSAREGPARRAWWDPRGWLSR